MSISAGHYRNSAGLTFWVESVGVDVESGEEKVVYHRYGAKSDGVLILSLAVFRAEYTCIEPKTKFR